MPEGTTCTFDAAATSPTAFAHHLFARAAAIVTVQVVLISRSSFLRRILLTVVVVVTVAAAGAFSQVAPPITTAESASRGQVVANATASSTASSKVPAISAERTPSANDESPPAAPVIMAALESGDCEAAGSYVQVTECWTALFADLTRSAGPAEALRSIVTVGEVQDSIALTCHEWTHVVGRVAFAEIGDVDEALTFDDRRCQFGYRHGVMEDYAKDASPEEMQVLMGSFCDASPKGSLEEGECLHALGHSASAYSSDDVVAAVTMCDLVPETGRRLQCVGGALMEYGNSFVSRTLYDEQPATGPGSAQITDDDARHLCDILPSEYTQECFLRIGNFWGPVLDRDFAEMARRCDAEAGEYVKWCMLSMGEWVNHQAAQESSAEGRELSAQMISKYCTAAGTSERQGWCLWGAVGPQRLGEMWSGAPEAEWTQVCATVPADVQVACLEAEADAEARFVLAQAPPQV